MAELGGEDMSLLAPYYADDAVTIYHDSAECGKLSLWTAKNAPLDTEQGAGANTRRSFNQGRKKATSKSKSTLRSAPDGGQSTQTGRATQLVSGLAVQEPSEDTRTREPAERVEKSQPSDTISTATLGITPRPISPLSV